MIGILSLITHITLRMAWYTLLTGNVNCQRLSSDIVKRKDNFAHYRNIYEITFIIVIVKQNWIHIGKLKGDIKLVLSRIPATVGELLYYFVILLNNNLSGIKRPICKIK